MPKMKTSKSAAKRFRVTKNGKVLHGKQNRRHNLGSMTKKCKLKGRGTHVLADADTYRIRRTLAKC